MEKKKEKIPSRLGAGRLFPLRVAICPLLPTQKLREKEDKGVEMDAEMIYVFC